MFLLVMVNCSFNVNYFPPKRHFKFGNKKKSPAVASGAYGKRCNILNFIFCIRPCVVLTEKNMFFSLNNHDVCFGFLWPVHHNTLCLSFDFFLSNQCGRLAYIPKTNRGRHLLSRFHRLRYLRGAFKNPNEPTVSLSLECTSVVFVLRSQLRIDENATHAIVLP